MACSLPAEVKVIAMPIELSSQRVVRVAVGDRVPGIAASTGIAQASPGLAVAPAWPVLGAAVTRTS